MSRHHHLTQEIQISTELLELVYDDFPIVSDLINLIALLFFHRNAHHVVPQNVFSKDTGRYSSFMKEHLGFRLGVRFRAAR